MIGTFYIASSRDGLEDVRALAQWLVGCGMRNAFAWWDHLTHRCFEDTCGILDHADLADRELYAASRCDLFVGVARLGKGAHAELGAALVGARRLKPRVILVGVDRSDSVFYDADRVEHAVDIDEVKRMLTGWP